MLQRQQTTDHRELCFVQQLLLSVFKKKKINPSSFDFHLYHVHLINPHDCDIEFSISY